MDSLSPQKVPPFHFKMAPGGDDIAATRLLKDKTDFFTLEDQSEGHYTGLFNDDLKIYPTYVGGLRRVGYAPKLSPEGYKFQLDIQDRPAEAYFNIHYALEALMSGNPLYQGQYDIIIVLRTFEDGTPDFRQCYQALYGYACLLSGLNNALSSQVLLLSPLFVFLQWNLRDHARPCETSRTPTHEPSRTPTQPPATPRNTESKGYVTFTGGELVAKTNDSVIFEVQRQRNLKIGLFEGLDEDDDYEKLEKIEKKETDDWMDSIVQPGMKSLGCFEHHIYQADDGSEEYYFLKVTEIDLPMDWESVEKICDENGLYGKGENGTGKHLDGVVVGTDKGHAFSLSLDFFSKKNHAIIDGYPHMHGEHTLFAFRHLFAPLGNFCLHRFKTFIRAHFYQLFTYSFH